MTEDAVWEALARALSGEYDIVGRIVIGRSGAPVYLARELVTGNLVALRLPPLVSGSDARESGLEIVRQIDGSLPGIVAQCSHCGAKVRQWARFCTRCGRDISGLDPSAAGQSRDQLLALAQRHAAGKYEVLGDMTRADGGGLVFFGRDLATGDIAALQLELGPNAVITMTTTQFAAPDPSIHIPEARHASSQQAARRISAAGAEPVPAPLPSQSTGNRRLAVAAVILLLVMGFVATCQIL